MKFLHSHRRDEQVNTSLGLFDVDKDGVIHDIKGADPAEVAKLPGFTALELVDPVAAEQPVPEPTPDPITPGEVAKNDGAGEVQFDLTGFIHKLLDEGVKTNSEGYIDMEVLNSALREAKQSVITGTQRKKFQDARPRTNVSGTEQN